MGLEEVKREILEKADLEAEKIIAEGRREADKIVKDTERQVIEYKEKADNDTSKILESAERKEKASAEFETKKALLDRKKEMVEKAFSEVKKRLAGMPEKRREEYLSRLFESAKKEIDVAYIHANSDDRKIAERMKGARYRQSDIAGGLIAENSDGSIRVDYSYEEILDGIKKENMQEIASKLFGR